MSYGLTREQRDLIEKLRGGDRFHQAGANVLERYHQTFRKLAEIERRESESMRNVPVKVKRLHPDATVPQYATVGAAGFDLVAVEDVIIAPGETVKVRTGLAFELPPGFELQIRPRSGISAKTKLRVANAPGTVDADYRGEVCVLVDNTCPESFRIEKHEEYPDTIEVQHGHTFDVANEDVMEIPYGEHPHGSYIIRKGDRIAQGVIAPVYRAAFEVVNELSETERGAGGFGSSGVRAEVSG